jgi:hypothetical protein
MFWKIEKMPKISVILPVYNSSKYLSKKLLMNIIYNSDNSASASHKFYIDRLNQHVYLISKLEKYFSKNDLYRLRWDFWNEVINHCEVKGLNSDDKIIKKIAKKKLKETYKASQFKTCIPYIRNNGSLDEKIRTYFISYYIRNLYKPILKLIQVLYRIKNMIIHS